jgi:hypothetical protein
MPLSFINNAKTIVLPTGGDFAPTGFIGLVGAKIYHSFMSQEDLTQYEGAPKFAARRPAGSWFVYYFDDAASAKAAMQIVGAENNPQQMWSFQIKRDSVMNFADKAKLENFSDPISFDVRVTTMKSKKYRHEFHMLALPFAVQAVAKALGYEHESFSVNELLGKEIIFTDELQKKLIGDGDSGYRESLLWQRRAALWASLGEPNPEAYLAKGADKLGTTSDKLNDCLSIVTHAWDTMTYARIAQIPDPRVDATYDKDGETKRNNIPAIFELFASKADAQAAAHKDLERMSKSDSAPSNGASAAVVPTPKAWEGLDNEWQAKVAELRGMSKPSAPQLAKLAKELDVTPADLNSVW